MYSQATAGGAQFENSGRVEWTQRATHSCRHASKCGRRFYRALGEVLEIYLKITRHEVGPIAQNVVTDCLNLIHAACRGLSGDFRTRRFLSVWLPEGEERGP